MGCKVGSQGEVWMAGTSGWWESECPLYIGLRWSPGGLRLLAWQSRFLLPYRLQSGVCGFFIGDKESKRYGEKRARETDRIDTKWENALSEALVRHIERTKR